MQLPIINKTVALNRVNKGHYLNATASTGTSMSIALHCSDTLVCVPTPSGRAGVPLGYLIQQKKMSLMDFLIICFNMFIDYD